MVIFANRGQYGGQRPYHMHFFIFQVIKIGGGGGELILSCKVNMFIYAIT